MLQRFIRTCLASSFFLSLSFTECYFRCAFHLKIVEWILYRNRGNLFKFTAGHPGRVLWSFGLLSLPSEQGFSALVLLRSCECPLKQHSPTGGAGRCNVLLICDSLLFAGVPPHLSCWTLVCQWIQLHCQFTVPCWEAAEGGNRHGDWFLSCLLMQVFISGVQLAGFCHLWIYPHLWTDISDDTGVSAGLVC